MELVLYMLCEATTAETVLHRAKVTYGRCSLKTRLDNLNSRIPNLLQSSVK